jgi:tetratricopeptide (TPR) repeat protein
MRRCFVGVAVVAAASIIGCGGPAHGPRLDPTLVAGQIAADPGNPYWRYRQAEIHVASGDHADAESELRVALESDPGHAAAWALLSRVWFETGRHDEAVRALERSRESGGFPDELAVALALHYDALDRIDETADLLASVTDANWSSVGPAITYLHLRSYDFARAEAAARRALDADSKCAPNHNNFGITQLHAGNPETARKAFLEAQKLDPGLPGPYYNLAIIDHFYLFDSDRARKWFRRYRELATDDPDDLAAELGITNSSQADESQEGTQ